MVRLTTWRTKRSTAASRRLGPGAPPRCACRGGIHPDYTTARPTWLIPAHGQGSSAAHARGRVFAARSQPRRRDPGRGGRRFLGRLHDAGPGARCPGTAAEILDDEVRKIICADKIRTAEWLRVMKAAHRLGLRSTATILFGHVETSRSIRRATCCACATIAGPKPAALRNCARPSSTWKRRCTLKGGAPKRADLARGFADARGGAHRAAIRRSPEYLRHPGSSWGRRARPPALRAGANDGPLGGTLMNESISRARRAMSTARARRRRWTPQSGCRPRAAQRLHAL